MWYKLATLQTQFRSEQQRRTIRETLGLFIEQGQDLHRQFADESGSPPEEEANNWARNVEEYLACFLQVGIPHYCKIFSPAPVGKN